MDIQNRIITGKQQNAQGRRLLNLTIKRGQEKKKIEVYPEVWGNEEIRVIGIGPKEIFSSVNSPQTCPPRRPA